MDENRQMRQKTGMAKWQIKHPQKARKYEKFLNKLWQCVKETDRIFNRQMAR